MSKAKSRPPVQTSTENERVSSSAPPAALDGRGGVHSRSHAAHLVDGDGEPHRKPAGDMRLTAPFPTGRKQP